MKSVASPLMGRLLYESGLSLKCWDGRARRPEQRNGGFDRARLALAALEIERTVAKRRTGCRSPPTISASALIRPTVETVGYDSSRDLRIACPIPTRLINHTASV
jgi:hypothetical protein